MKRVTLIITAVLTVLMLTACSSNKVVYESNTESQGGNKGLDCSYIYVRR